MKCVSRIECSIKSGMVRDFKIVNSLATASRSVGGIIIIILI